ncbi:MAG: hypothetical protein AUF79_00040 [Crenarchaeota archaeon 13_1_20CM_2_51_8]|nr:MAG: hypothetical protein AUF79_00040 [Crenarchaeota archaeon 13_1_20CM_2_51_8]
MRGCTRQYWDVDLWTIKPGISVLNDHWNQPSFESSAGSVQKVERSDGILAIISSFNSRVRLSDLDLMVNIATYGLLVIVLGLIAILGSKHVSSLAWGVSIVGIGLLAYRFGANYLYNLGPIMIIIAGIVAVAVRLS